ncbi:hypothetical protein [Serratia sarumanii]|uniref:hypothetical protein n=1 Tax=Serratia sarumanii TaxID=3020826 RepID=UPI003F6C1CD5
MTTIKRFTPDYKMHAVRFEAFAREAEHGEYVRFDAHQQTVSALEAERDALADRVERLSGMLTESRAATKSAEERADALAVENTCLVSAITDHKNSTHFCERCGEDDPCATDDVCGVLRGIPDTDAALAAIQAQGVEKAIERLMNMFASTGHIGIPVMALEGLAKELREAK